MSVSLTVYAGNYLKVWMPKTEREGNSGACRECGVQRRAKFCKSCGTKIEFDKAFPMQSMWGYLEKVFVDEDQFQTCRDKADNFHILTPNLPEQAEAGSYLDEYELEHEMPPPFDFSGDWEILIASLSQDNIRHEKKHGIITYWS